MLHQNWNIYFVFIVTISLKVSCEINTLNKRISIFSLNSLDNLELKTSNPKPDFPKKRNLFLINGHISFIFLQF
ncbi:hypothetical protein BpHYR1_053967 [Brachionus plicatilis]|uniref:Uncharacterized protein n=1 Tax=Brachionus plicatilis TaxID=10195 RepID=A0A3M7PMK5_BRAPC|nr:hypothetical protein BpHYR1_053967 [Brachionus plicatilis]